VKPVSVLLFELVPGDLGGRIEEELRRAGYRLRLRRVTSLARLSAELAQSWELLIFHCQLGDLASALSLCRERAPDTPLIVLSETIGEEATAGLLKAGVGDVVLMSGLSRLGPAVQGELEEAERRRRERLESQALRASEELFRRLVEGSPDVIYRYRLRPQPACEYVSPAVRAMTGYAPEDFLADPFLALSLVHPDDRPLLEHLARARAPTLALVRWRRRDGGLVWTEHRSVPILDERRRVRAIEGMVRDVTERERAAQALRTAEERLRLALATAGMAAWERDLASDEVRWSGSEQMIALLGLSPEEARMPFARLRSRVHPDDVEAFDRAAAARLAGAEVELEYRLRAPDGGYRWITSRGGLVRAAEGELLLGVWLDTTARRRAEDELGRLHLERRRLLERVVRAQEEERRRIAADIHDDSVQVLTALALRLDLLREHLADIELARSLEEVARAARDAISRLRRLIFDLRPAVLDRDGLVSALRPYLDQLRLEQGLDYELYDRLEGEPDPEARTVLYRIAQEALANVVKHARARKVEVRLEEEGGQVVLRVSDDGCGFSLADAERLGDPWHLGLTAMRERAEMAGGACRIVSAPGAGTSVEARVPRGPRGREGDGGG
jgi:PAS domain S-box-containing protein